MPVLLWAAYRYTASKLAIASLLVIAATGFLVSAGALGLNVGERTLNLNSANGSLTQDASTSTRLMIWKSTLAIVRDHPLVGTGWGTFAAHYPAYRDPKENTSSGTLAHNDYLQLASEGGIPALILFGGIVAGLLLQLKSALRMPPSVRTLEAAGLLLAALALFIHAVVNFIFYYAFMNILTGLLVGRAMQLLYPAGLGTRRIPQLAQVGSATKLLVAGLATLLLAGPLILQLVAQTALVGKQPGLAVIKRVWPNADAYSIAKFIAALRPTSVIAQDAMLHSGEITLQQASGFNINGGGMQHALLQETLDRYEFVRANTANNPAFGIREAITLIRYRDVLEPGVALARARAILMQNLRTDPFNVDSIITLSRLDLIDRQPQQSRQVLTAALSKVLSQRDYQLLLVEILRHQADPDQMGELKVIEKQLREIRPDSETGKFLKLPAGYSEDIDHRLDAIAKAIRARG
jgi:hypothetical protein